MKPAIKNFSVTIPMAFLAFSLVLSTSACSSKSSEQKEKIASCEQVKEFDEEIYQKCLEEAKKDR